MLSCSVFPGDGDDFSYWFQATKSLIVKFAPKWDCNTNPNIFVRKTISPVSFAGGGGVNEARMTTGLQHTWNINSLCIVIVTG